MMLNTKKTKKLEDIASIEPATYRLADGLILLVHLKTV